MKFSITDKFLWEIYNDIISPTDDIIDFLLSNRYRQVRLLFGNENPIFRKYRKERGARKFAKIIYYLKSRNYIKTKKLKGKRAIILTKKGIDKIFKASFTIEGREKRKDGKWIMLMFDVPEKYRKSRDLLRSILHNLGYKEFQKSVWVTPYNVSEKTEKLLQMYSLEKFTKIFLIEEI